MRFIRQTTATTVTVGPFVDYRSGVSEESNVGLAAMDNATLHWHNSGTSLDLMNPPRSWVHRRGGMYDTALYATDVSRAGQLRIHYRNEDAFLAVWEDFTVLNPAIYDMFISGVTTDTSIGVTVKAGVSNPTGLTTGVSNPTGLVGLSGISNPTGLTSGVSNPSVHVRSGVTINDGTYSGVTWGWLSGLDSSRGGVTVVGGVSNPTGLVGLSGISNPAVTIVPGTYTNTTFSVTGVSNPAFHLKSGVTVNDGIYSGVTWGWISGLASGGGGVTVVGGVSNPGGISGVSNPAVHVKSGVTINAGTYSGVSIGGVSNVDYVTKVRAGVTVEVGTYATTIFGVTGVSNPTGLTSGVSNPAVDLNVDQSSVTIGWVLSGVTVVSGISNPTGLTSGVSHPAVHIKSGVTVNDGIYSGVTWGGLSGLDSSRGGVTVVGGVSNPESITGVSNPTGLTTGVSNPTGLVGLSGISNPTGLTNGVSNPAVTVTAGVSHPGTWSSTEQSQIRNAIGVSGTTTTSAASGHLQFVYDMLAGRHWIHTTNNEMYFFGASKYRGTGVTIATYDLFDSAGGATYQNVYQRKIDTIIE